MTDRMNEKVLNNYKGLCEICLEKPATHTLPARIGGDLLLKTLQVCADCWDRKEPDNVVKSIN